MDTTTPTTSDAATAGPTSAEPALPGATAGAERVVTGTAADRATFQQLLDDWAAAIVSDDAARIAEFMSPGWYLVTPESGPITCERFLSVVASGDLSHSEMTFEVLDVRLAPGVAVVTARGANQGTFRGAPFNADEWVTEVFVDDGERWRAVASALTPSLPPGERGTG